MKVVLDSEGYVESYVLLGDVTDGIEVEEPEDFQDFENNYPAYRIENGKLKKDELKCEAFIEETELNGFRSLRKRECFPIINRGELWYETLTAEQREEISQWYQAWLDITETKTIPAKPDWIK
jgi:hypothetical protein